MQQSTAFRCMATDVNRKQCITPFLTLYTANTTNIAHPQSSHNENSVGRNPCHAQRPLLPARSSRECRETHLPLPLGRWAGQNAHSRHPPRFLPGCQHATQLSARPTTNTLLMPLFSNNLHKTSFLHQHFDICVTSQRILAERCILQLYNVAERCIYPLA